jgi:vacuolar-type H+-ATPase subunit I/STV1
MPHQVTDRLLTTSALSTDVARGSAFSVLGEMAIAAAPYVVAFLPAAITFSMDNRRTASIEKELDATRKNNKKLLAQAEALGEKGWYDDARELITKAIEQTRTKADERIKFQSGPFFTYQRALSCVLSVALPMAVISTIGSGLAVSAIAAGLLTQYTSHSAELNDQFWVGCHELETIPALQEYEKSIERLHNPAGAPALVAPRLAITADMEEEAVDVLEQLRNDFRTFVTDANQQMSNMKSHIDRLETDVKALQEENHQLKASLEHKQNIQV